MKNKKLVIFFCAVLVLALVWVGVQWAVLPAEVAMQIGSGGARQNMMPKPIAVAIPFLVTVASAGIFCKNSENKSYALVALLGLLMPIFTLVINR